MWHVPEASRQIDLFESYSSILFVVSMASHHMHDLRKGNINVTYRILRYLKCASGSGLIFIKNGHLHWGLLWFWLGLLSRWQKVYILLLRVCRPQLGLLKEQEIVSCCEINDRSKVQGHNLRGCWDVIVENSLERAQDRLRSSNEVMVR